MYNQVTTIYTGF